MRIKTANTEYQIHELLQRRWSPRAFAERQVEPEKLRRLFEAARWAPSSYNEQPWSFMVATKDHSEQFERLLNCMVEKNIKWAQNAPVLMLSVAKLDFERTGKSNRHAFHDVGMAMENLIIQATVMKLFVHQMAGFHADKARRVFKIPEGYEPVAMIALGYLGDIEILPEELAERETAERSRKPINEFVFSGEWGKPSPLIKT